jgi:hypothetical protein
MPPIIKCRGGGALCHVLCVGVRKHLVSVNYRTNAWVDWSDFSVAYWGWLEEGSFRWSAPSLIQDGHHLGFGFCRLEDKYLGRLIRFFYGLLGATRRFLSMTSAATHPTWPLWQPLVLVSVDYLTNACVNWSDFFVACQSSAYSTSPQTLSSIYRTHGQLPTWGGAYATPCVALVFW